MEKCNSFRKKLGVAHFLGKDEINIGKIDCLLQAF
jgi:hypothetical protein